MFNGGLIRKLRTERKMSLQELSSKSGVSPAMISQIERGNADPTFTTLYKICKGLDITITTLINDEVDLERVVKKNQRREMFLPNSKIKYELLSPSARNNLAMIIVEIEPGKTDKKYVTHEGEECGLVLQGKMTVVLGDKEYHLEEGDSISFESTIPHYYINYSDQKSISVWAMTPPTF